MIDEDISTKGEYKKFTKDQSEVMKNKQEIKAARIVNKDFIRLELILCFICNNVLVDIRKCSICSKHFCLDCIEKFHADQGNKCPSCQNEEMKILPGEAYISKFIQELLISCKNIEKGCEEICSYKNIFEHESICSYREKYCENCDALYNYEDYYRHILDCFKVSEQTESDFKQKTFISLVRTFEEKACKINYDNKSGINNFKLEINKSMCRIKDKIRILEKFVTENEYLVRTSGLEKYKLNSPFSLFGKSFKECQIYYFCKGGYNGCNKTGNVWGSNPYTSDSVICLAAIHSGHISKEGGLFIVKKGGPLDSYYGSVRNGLSTQSYGSFDHMLLLPPEIDIKISFSNNQCGPKIGICKGKNNNCIDKGDVWGDNPYVRESNLCKAALHSGFINENGGIYMIEESGTHGGYTGSNKNSVTSLPCSSNRASIMIKPFMPY